MSCILNPFFCAWIAAEEDEKNYNFHSLCSIFNIGFFWPDKPNFYFQNLIFCWFISSFIICCTSLWSDMYLHTFTWFLIFHVLNTFYIPRLGVPFVDKYGFSFEISISLSIYLSIYPSGIMLKVKDFSFFSWKLLKGHTFPIRPGVLLFVFCQFWFTILIRGGAVRIG